jgi:hypothetical protein
MAAKGDGLSPIDMELDEVSRSVWGASSAEMSVLREALGEIREALAQVKGDEDGEEED